MTFRARCRQQRVAADHREEPTVNGTHFAENRGEMIRRSAVQVQQLLDWHGIPLRVAPGADVRIEVVENLPAGRARTLAGGDAG